MKSFLRSSLTSTDSRRAAVSYWRKCGHLVLINRLEGLSLPRISVDVKQQHNIIQARISSLVKLLYLVVT